MKQLLAWTIRTTLRPALSPKTPLKLQRFCSDAASAIVLGPRGYKTKKQTIAQVPTVHIQPKTTQSGVGILYLHGGGYVVGSSKVTPNLRRKSDMQLKHKSGYLNIA